jgi:hypothetical protein
MFGFFLLNPIFVSGEDYFQCGFVQGTCGADYESVLFGNFDYHDLSGNVLSSNVAIGYDANYNKSLCCKITDPNLGNVKFNVKSISDSCNGGDEILYFTDSTNSRIAIQSDNIAFDSPPSLDMTNYKYKLCVDLPNDFSKLDVLISSKNDYAYAGYQCLFKTSDLENGLVSSCDAEFAGSQSYKYTIWARLWENTESLKCDSGCRSLLDGRVYNDCGSIVSECRSVPVQCNGALYGSWVSIDPYTEIKCESPWNQKRFSLITETPVKVELNNCTNTVMKSYPVIFNDVLVNMKIYICDDQE